jgi:hypothetical protein
MIKKAVLALPEGLGSIQTLSGKLHDDQALADQTFDLFKLPYRAPDVPQPPFCFGEGISILAHIFG